MRSETKGGKGGKTGEERIEDTTGGQRKRPDTQVDREGGGGKFKKKQPRNFNKKVNKELRKGRER